MIEISGWRMCVPDQITGYKHMVMFLDLVIVLTWQILVIMCLELCLGRVFIKVVFLETSDSCATVIQYLRVFCMCVCVCVCVFFRSQIYKRYIAWSFEFKIYMDYIMYHMQRHCSARQFMCCASDFLSLLS